MKMGMTRVTKICLQFALICTVVLIAVGTMAGCSSKQKLYVFNYGDYLDPEIISDFENEFGVKIVYDEYAAPEDMYAKFTSGANQYDVVCSSEYMLEKLMINNLVEPFDPANIPNYSNLSDTARTFMKIIDPESKYVIPQFWGTVGILYDSTKVTEEEVSSWSILMSDKYKGQIIMPNSERDSMLVALKILGYDLNTTDKKQLDEAAELLIKQKPLVQAYLLDKAARLKIVSGNAAMAVVYSGEAYLASEEDSNIKYSIPKEGTNIWLDAWVIAKDAPNKALAETFLNYLCRPEVALKNFEYIYYTTPNQAALDLIDDEKVTKNPAMFPDNSIKDSSTVYKYLGAEIEEYYSQLWKKIKSK